MVRKKIRKVGWKIASTSFEIASLRYRALYPALALSEQEIESRIFHFAAEEQLQDLDVLVIVKSFKSEDLLLAQRAAEKGVRVVFDLCDNIFINAYGGKAKNQILDTFLAIAEYVDAVIVTTQPLADAVQVVLPHVDVYVIPDAIEGQAMLVSARQLLENTTRQDSALQRKVLLKAIKYDLLCLVYKGPRVYKKIAKSWLGGIRKISRGWIKTGFRLLKKIRVHFFPQEKYTPSSHKHLIVWFGNHGAPHANFGMLDLLIIKDALETAAKEFDVELVVVSNHYEKYLENIAPLSIPSRYLPWSPEQVNRCLDSASLVVVPNSLDAFSLCKSANRTLLALQHGIPVVATATPGLEPLAQYVHLGDPTDGIRKYLNDTDAGKKQAQAGAKYAKELFGLTSIGKQWAESFETVAAKPSMFEPVDAKILCVLHLIQDLDLALPVIQSLQKTHSQTPLALVSDTLVKKSPRVLAALREHSVPLKILTEASISKLDFPPSAESMLTVAETNLGPHRFTRLLTELAKSKGLHTATMQHGYENVGLTYSDAEHPIRTVNIAADKIYIWGDLERLHSEIPSETRERCVSVGCPKPPKISAANLDNLIPPQATVIGVFENLHWKRYSDAYRHAFLSAVQSVAEAHPDVVFLVKPHHAGLWLTQRHKGAKPQSDNVIIADPQATAWERHTAGALLGRMSAVITTPSTVALDAARMRLPTSVFSFDLALPNYEPLPLLVSAQDMLDFVQNSQSEERMNLLQAADHFVERVLYPGDAAQRIASGLVSIHHALESQ